MDLRNEKRISTPECFVCRWAGKHIILWPQQPILEPEDDVDEVNVYASPTKVTRQVQYTSGEWKVYAKIEEVIRTQFPNENLLRSRHMNIVACGKHWYALADNWVQVAWEEVALACLWDSYIERMER